MHGPSGRRIELQRMGFPRRWQFRSVGYGDEGLHHPKGWRLSDEETFWLFEAAQKHIAAPPTPPALDPETKGTENGAT